MKKATRKRPDESTTTPGRPKESGTRQQRVHNQGSQSGSRELDEDSRKRGDVPVPAVPPGAK